MEYLFEFIVGIGIAILFVVISNLISKLTKKEQKNDPVCSNDVVEFLYNLPAGIFSEVITRLANDIENRQAPELSVHLSTKDKYWHVNGKLHRTDGPAVEWSNGDKFWYQNGNHHREDGPAVEKANGHKEWWLHGVRVCNKQD